MFPELGDRPRKLIQFHTYNIYTCTARTDTRMDGCTQTPLPIHPIPYVVCDKRTEPHLYCMFHKQVSGIGSTEVMYQRLQQFS